MISKDPNSIFDDERERFEDAPPQRGHFRGARRSRGGGRGGHRGYNDPMRGGNRRGNRRGLHGKLERSPNYNLQERFKDEFDFSKHELHKEGEENKSEDKPQEDSDNEDKEENIAKDQEGDDKEENSNEPSSVGGGFFDDFSNSTLKDENEGRNQNR